MNRLKVLVLLLVLTSCAAPIGQEAAISSSPTADERPTHSPAATITPTATPIPSPTIPPLDTTDKGYPLVVLDGPEGALYRLGMGWRDEAAVSPDSHLIALPATTGLYVYRADDLELVWAATGTSFVRKAVWSPDGSRVIGLHDDSTVSIFDASDGSLLYQFPVDASSSFSLPRNNVEISPDNHLLFAGKRLYDAASGEELACAYCPQTYDPDYDAYLTFTADSVLRTARPCDEAIFCLWDSDSGETDAVPYPLPGVQNGGPLSISPDGNWVLIQADNTIRLFDVQAKTYHLITELTDAPFEKYFLPEAKSITWAPDSSAFIIQSDERTYLFQTGAEVSTLNWLKRVPTVWSPDSSMILYSRPNSVAIYESGSGELLFQAEGRDARAILDNGSILWEYYFNRDYYGLVVSRSDRVDYDHSLMLNINAMNLVSAGWTPDNLLLIAADQPEFLFLDGATGEPVAVMDAGAIHTGSPSQRDFQWSADGRQLVWIISENFSKLPLWDRATGELTNIFNMQDRKIDINCIALSSDSRRLLVGSSKKSIIALFDVETGEKLRQINEDDYSTNGLIDLAFSPDGRQFASIGVYSIDPIIIWDTETFTPLYKLMLAEDDQTALDTINWVGDLIVTSGRDGVFVWQASTQSLLWAATLMPRNNNCRASLEDIDNQIAFSPDGQYVAVLAGGATQGCERIAVYEAHTGKLLHIYPGNGTYGITQLAWSPDGQYLASVAQGDTIVVWDTSLLPEVEQP